MISYNKPFKVKALEICMFHKFEDEDFAKEIFKFDIQKQHTGHKDFSILFVVWGYALLDLTYYIMRDTDTQEKKNVQI